jgi:uncharacterized membrane protein HdeD (DUF308 family)
MKLSAETFGLLVIARIVLDVVSARRPSWKFDLVYAALFLVLGIATLLSNDSDSLLIGSVATGVAFIWGGWVCVREFGITKTFPKTRKHR